METVPGGRLLWPSLFRGFVKNDGQTFTYRPEHISPHRFTHTPITHQETLENKTYINLYSTTVRLKNNNTKSFRSRAYSICLSRKRSLCELGTLKSRQSVLVANVCDTLCRAADTRANHSLTHAHHLRFIRRLYYTPSAPNCASWLGILYSCSTNYN